VETNEVQAIIRQELQKFQTNIPKKSPWLDWHKWLNTILLGVMGWMVIQMIADFRSKMKDNSNDIKTQTETISKLTETTAQIVTLMQVHSEKISDIEEGRHISTANRYTKNQALLDMDEKIRKELREFRQWSLDTFEKKK